MTTTIDVPDDVIQRAMRATGANSPEEAVVKALQDFVSRHDQRALIPLLGTLDDDFLPPEELERMRNDE
jgi:hypothetical protein